jgi:prepilin-type N-terminal cleavage/methylation domain-containing protein
MLRTRAKVLSTESGFTLVELLVVLLLLGVVGGFVTTSIITSLQASRRGEARVMALNDLQLGIERVGRELRAAEELRIEPGSDPAQAIGAQVIRNGQRVTYRYYLVPVGDGAELREDVTRRSLSNQLISERNGLFITDISNLETGTPLFRYLVTDPTTGQLEELDCDGLSEAQCEQRHATATQIQLTLGKLLPEQEPIEVETVINIRSVRIGS